MKTDTKKPLSIFMVNFDWDDMFRNSFTIFKEKLDRDKLIPDVNTFFFFSWSRISYDSGYDSKADRFKTVHVKTRIYKLKPLLDIRAMFAVRAAAQKYAQRPDVWMTYDFGMLPALWLAKKRHGGKIVLCVSNQPTIYSKTRRFGLIKGWYSWISERMWWRLADHFFTINETMRSYLQDIGIPANDITVFTIDTIERDRRFIDKVEAGTIRKKYNIPPHMKILVTVARLEAEKNYPLLLDLCAGLGPNYVLIALGRGSLLASLTEQAKKLGMKERVIFTGLVSREEIWNYYRDADAFVLLSKAEALGLVFWEAMYMNVPVIGSTADGIVETIGKDGERGRIWSSDLGQKGFNERVEYCVTPSTDRDAMRARAKEYVVLQRQNSVTLNDLYESIIFTK